MKIRSIPVLLLIMLSSATAFAQATTPSAAVDSFYKMHLAAPQIFNAKSLKARSKWFTPELNALFLNELKREKAYLKINPTDKPHFGDGFPFQPLDECPKKERLLKQAYTVRDTTSDDDTATVEVMFSTPPACGSRGIEVYKVQMVKRKNKWLINDWTYPEGETLSADLRRKEY